VLVREVIAGIAEILPLDGVLDDVRGAVSEACNNVILHAYGGQEGPMEIDARLRPGTLEIRVRDRGAGFPHSIAAELEQDEARSAGCGIGLEVIAALSDDCEIRSWAGRGSEVTMRFPLAAGPIPSAALDRRIRPPIERLGAESDVEIAIAPPALRRSLLGRLVSALAARAGFSLDRLSDAQLLSDALAASIKPPVGGPYLRVGVASCDRTLTLRAGGLRAGASAQLAADSRSVALADLSRRLAAEFDCGHTDTGDMLTLVIRDQPRRSSASS